MKATISRRLALLEARQAHTARYMHIIAATDQDDANRQVADLISAGAVRGHDGFLCLTGKPLILPTCQ
ncbi:hypothetical protein [Bradyrhizobium sp. AS23.2]|uniref:hypothetical protein n=1 Tax=Bradyrhizobium sp. AS23.2 TaxID=1680155 RepID=UPI00093D90E8|nr:hypothetical protein [Bradyrhizobium sp. AS23.2]OKO69710.1 hypothetical protein AC630_36265 [Bradyrhizobium sp. AS23.2]